MSKADDLKKALRAKKEQSPVLTAKDFLSTGSTLLNLACSGHIDGGFPRGLYTYLVGDSSSGKTWLTLTCLAEAVLNPSFRKYRFIHDNAENGALMDIAHFFGEEVERRLEPPAGTKDSPICSSTVEEFYYHTDDALQQRKPFIYILDSMDALTTGDEGDQFQKEKQAHEKGKEVSGSYGTSKAKQNSARLRVLCNGLRETGSILIIVSQTRDNIGWNATFQPKTRSGGNALNFFARLVIWSSIREKLKKRIRGEERQVGIKAQLRLAKNHITGWEGKVEVPIYRKHGIDDLGSCVDYLVSEGHWKKGKGDVISAPDLGVELEREALIQYVEEAELAQDVRQTVGEVWADVEKACAIQRRSRYTR